MTKTMTLDDFKTALIDDGWLICPSYPGSGSNVVWDAQKILPYVGINGRDALVNIRPRRLDIGSGHILEDAFIEASGTVRGNLLTVGLRNVPIKTVIDDMGNIIWSLISGLVVSGKERSGGA